MSARRRWHPGVRMTVFVAAMLPVVLGLAMWQLDRAAEKRTLEDQYYDRIGSLPREPDASGGLEPFSRLRLQGAYRPGRVFLVDNQTHGGRPGYWVIAVFEARDGRRWLVNRGWLGAGFAREELPEVGTPRGSLELVAVVWPDTGLVPLLAADPFPPGWPKRMQRLDTARLAEHEAAVPVELRLEAGQPGALVPASQNVDFSPEQHQGYAVQWFGLGAALLLGYLAFGFRRDD